MKKILTLCVLATLNLSAKHDEPKLILEYKYSNVKFLDQVKKLEIDSSFCCMFKVKFIKNKGNENITVIKHRKTGKELGIIYGTPTKEFISMVYETYFTDELVKDMIH